MCAIHYPITCISMLKKLRDQLSPSYTYSIPPYFFTPMSRNYHGSLPLVSWSVVIIRKRILDQTLTTIYSAALVEQVLCDMRLASVVSHNSICIHFTNRPPFLCDPKSLALQLIISEVATLLKHQLIGMHFAFASLQMARSCLS